MCKTGALSGLSYSPWFRDKESNPDLHVQSVASCRLDDPGAVRSARSAKNAHPSIEERDVPHHTCANRFEPALENPSVHGSSLLGRAGDRHTLRPPSHDGPTQRVVLTKSKRCFSSHSLYPSTLDRHATAVRGRPTWRGFGARCLHTFRAILFGNSAISAQGPFSLERGLDPI